MKKKLIINLTELVTLDYVNNISLLYRIINNFNSILDRMSILPSSIKVSNLLILYNKSYDKYIIFGLEFNNNKSTLIDIFTNKFNIDFKSFSKNIQFVYFMDNINDDIEKKIEQDIYKHNVSVITNKFHNNKYLPIMTMNEKFSRYLSNVLFFIKYNVNEVSKSDYIIISKDGYNSKLMTLEYILQLDNYEIIGNKDNSGIKNGSHNLNVIKELFNKNDTGIRDLDIDSFYKTFNYIIFNTQFIVNIIDNVQEKDILDLSIICSYYDQF